MRRRRKTRLRATMPPRCSICRGDVEGDPLTYRDEGESGRPARDVGVYCRPRCRDAAQALAALTDFPPFTPRPVIAQRSEVADGLLALWRRRVGPDPLLVLAA